jgi:hypothetical protein
MRAIVTIVNPNKPKTALLYGVLTEEGYDKPLQINSGFSPFEKGRPLHVTVSMAVPDRRGSSRRVYVELDSEAVAKIVREYEFIAKMEQRPVSWAPAAGAGKDRL